MSTTEQLILAPDAPAVPGLSFRHFRGDSDYPLMVDILQGCKVEDDIERVDSVEEISRNYSHLQNCDPNRDMVFAEVDGEAVGYGRVTWWQEDNDPKPYIYLNFGWLLPEWRRKGIGTAMMRWQEARLREIAEEQGHPADVPRFFQNWAADSETAKTALIEQEGYKPITYEASMVRPNLENIPDLPLPEGVEIRPVKPEHYRAIWEHDVEAFHDHWGFSEDMMNYEEFIDFAPYMDPSLWRVAWHGDTIVGQVLNFIIPEENEEYNRKRGYTESIAVRREYRRQGIASAVIAASLRMHKELGMEEAALGVHTENPNGAFQLYEKMGYRVVKMHTTYRKPVA